MISEGMKVDWFAEFRLILEIKFIVTILFNIYLFYSLGHWLNKSSKNYSDFHHFVKQFPILSLIVNINIIFK